MMIMYNNILKFVNPRTLGQHRLLAMLTTDHQLVIIDYYLMLTVEWVIRTYKSSREVQIQK